MTAPRKGGRVRVKTGKGRTVSSKRWLERQLNDPYVARAKRDGLRSRAAFKLIEIDDKHHLLKPGARVVDLGAAPGGWSQVAAERVGAGRRGHVLAIDMLDMDAVPGVEFRKLDFLDAQAPEQLKAALGGERRRRAVRHGGQCHRSPADRPSSHHGAGRGGGGLRPRGAQARRRFLAKVLQGGTESALLADLKRDFASVKHVKPPASRADSAELYLLATGFRHSRARSTLTVALIGSRRAIRELGAGCLPLGVRRANMTRRCRRDQADQNEGRGEVGGGTSRLLPLR